MKLRLSELQESDSEARKIRAEGYVEVNQVLHHYRLPFVPEVIQTELINRHHHDPLAGYFSINKIKELIGRKYYWPKLWKDVETYVRGCNIFLALKVVRDKPYGNLQLLPILTHYYKDLSMDFMTEMPVSID